VEPNAPGLVSGEGVRLALSPAGVGSRVIAAALDAAIQALALLVLILVDAAIASGADSAAVGAVVIVEAVLVLAGYPIVAEWLSRGRTVGKAALGLRVVRDDGGPIGFRQALVRGLAGLILEKPGLLAPLTTIAGMLTISSSAREKRIGDMMAGTVVLNERSAPQALAALPPWVPVPLQSWVLSLDLHRLDDRLALSARQFVARAHAMTLPAQAALGEDLRQRVLAVTAPPPPPGTPTPALLVSVLAERRRRAEAAAAPAQANGTPGHWPAPVQPAQSPPAYPPGYGSGFSPGYAPPPAPPQAGPPPAPPDSPFAPPT
jgi:uncharacterized RDD family membrane protein YckC